MVVTFLIFTLGQNHAIIGMVLSRPFQRWQLLRDPIDIEKLVTYLTFTSFRSRKSVSFSMLFFGIAKSTHYRSQIWIDVAAWPSIALPMPSEAGAPILDDRASRAHACNCKRALFRSDADNTVTELPSEHRKPKLRYYLAEHRKHIMSALFSRASETEIPALFSQASETEVPALFSRALIETDYRDFFTFNLNINI